MRRLLTTVPLLYFFLNISGEARSADSTEQKKIYVFEVSENIFPAAWRKVKNAVTEAEKLQADFILLKLNTYGGDLVSADSIHNKLLHAKPVVLVWITQNAGSAGALIALSCDSIYMRSSAIIGAASVVNQSGEVMPDKYQSYMRAMMRSTAEKTGRDPRIAEGMVSPSKEVSGIADSGQIISLTASEALAVNYCDGLAESAEEVFRLAGITSYETTEHQTDALDALISFLLNPVVNSILLLIILGGIYFEFQHPGAAFPILASIAAAVLYFAPLYLDGLAEHWEILIFIAGILLIAVELFFIPGFGVPGILGIILAISGLTLALLRNVTFDFSPTSSTDVLVALIRVVIPMALSMLLFILISPSLFRTKAFRGFILNDTQESSVGYLDQPNDLRALIHESAIAMTPLRPAGQVEVHGNRYDAMADSGMVNKGETVRIIDVSGNILVVRKS